jgi:hypothetical protein
MNRRLEQFSKTHPPIFLSLEPLSKVTEARERHALKQQFSSANTLAGIQTDCRLGQPSKAPFAIVVRREPLSKVIEERGRQP